MIAPPTSKLLPLIEKGLNHLIAQDVSAQAGIASLPDGVIQLDISGPDIRLYIKFGACDIYLLQDFDGDVQVRVKGSPMALMRMTREDHRHHVLSSRDVEIIGDLGLVQQLQLVLADLGIDWEEWLSQYTGDIAAHQIGRATRAFASWLKESHESFEQNISEYLKDESNVIPQREQVSEFLDSVDELNADTDRLEVRFRHLRDKL